MINFEILSRPRSAAIVAAGAMALAGCTGSKSPESQLPNKSDKSEPELAAAPSKETTTGAPSQPEENESQGLGICELTGGTLSGAISVFDKGKTAGEIAKDWAPKIERDFGVDDEMFRDAVDSGLIHLHKQTSDGPEISPDSIVDSATSSVGFDLRC